MATIIERLKETIIPTFIPADQAYMTESIVVGRTPLTMHTEIICNKNQEYLLCQFDRQGLNNQLFPYFNPKVEGLVSMCDYILFVEENTRLLVLLLELKHRNSPKRQLDINESFGLFICNRLRVLFEDFGKTPIIRKIGVKESYNPMHSTQDYRFGFDDEGFALLPNPHTLKLQMVSKVISQ